MGEDGQSDFNRGLHSGRTEPSLAATDCSITSYMQTNFYILSPEASFKISSPLKGACPYSPWIFDKRKSSKGGSCLCSAGRSLSQLSWSASHRSKLGNTWAVLLELTMKTPFPAHRGLLILIRWPHQVRNHNHLLKPLNSDPKAP